MTADTKSRQPRAGNVKESTPWLWVSFEDFVSNNAVPSWGQEERIPKLREAAREEPILAGAVFSLCAKAVALDFQITGGKRRVVQFQELLADEPEDGKGWSYLLDRWAQDYFLTDRGGFLELARDGKFGPVTGLYNLDAETMRSTGSVIYPVRYYPKLTTGQPGARSIPFTRDDYAHIVDMPSADESKRGLGFCAASRALKAATVLLGLYDYESERLADMPLPGICTVTGMTEAEVQEAFRVYKAGREANDQYTFKDVLFMAAQTSQLGKVQVDLTSFAGLPDGFNREQTITHYVYTLALDFGVDVREFWPASQTGATKAEAEIQHEKAKGKGFGRFLSSVERAINWDVLPKGLEFAFDNIDGADDLLAASVREKQIANVRRLWEPPMGRETGIIDDGEARRWLAELGAVPEWLSPSGQVTLTDTSEIEDGDEFVADIVEKSIAEKVARADLGRNEPLVSMNRAGQSVTIWSPRSVFFMPGWPVRAAAKEEARPFLGSTTEYP